MSDQAEEKFDRSAAEDPDVSIQVRWSRVMADLMKVGKTGHYRDNFAEYNFRGIDAVVNEVGPAVRRHGVVITPKLLEVTYDMVTRASGKPARTCQVIVEYTAHGPAKDSLTIAVVPGESFDTADKAVTKAMSVAWRTALGQALTLPTGDPDPDNERIELGNERSSRSRGRKGSGGTDQAWFDDMRTKVAEADTKTKLQNLWRQSAQGNRDGKCTEAEAIGLQQAITERTAALSALEQPLTAQRQSVAAASNGTGGRV